MKTKLFRIFLLFVLVLWTSQTYAVKYVLHMENVYNGNSHFCITSYPNDTIVIYELPYCTNPAITIWKVNGVPVGSGDSLVYVPTGPGDVQITSDCGTPFHTGLSFYSAPPSHALFTAGTGGTVNTTNDTIFMCGNSVSISSNTIGSEATSYSWHGPSGFLNTSADPINLSVPGTYYFERTNSCGVVRDTFELVSLPSSLPSLGNDTTFCNISSVGLLLDAGIGWNYSWSTGATTQTINVVAPGTYTVSVSNICTSGTSNITVYHQTYPEPDLSNFTTLPRCHDVVETVNPSPGFTYDSYLWSTGATTPSITVTAPSALYLVTVTKGMCSATAYASLEFFELPWRPSICIATVDLLSPHNVVRFKSIPDDPAYHGTMIQFYSVYKYEITTGNKTLLGTIPEPGTETLLEFTDLASNPAVQATAYVISSTDTCGVESILSYYNRTIKIDVDIDTQAGKVDLTIVDEYLDESGLYTPSWYYIIEDLNGTITIIDSLSGGNHQYSVLNPVFGASYLMGIALPWTCDPNKGNLYETMSFSNKSPIYTGVAENELNKVSVHPNPATNQIRIEGISGGNLRLYDLTGKLLLEQENTDNTLNLSGISAGSYVIEWCSENGIGRGRVVVE